MIVGPDRFVDVFDAIEADKSNSTEKKVDIFVAATSCDSVCALRILQALLQSRAIHFSINLVTRYEEVKAFVKQELDGNDTELRTLVLVNCGAQEDVKDLLALGGTTRAIIIDSHRPIHHHYATEDSNILFFHDPADGTSVDDLPPPDGVSDDEVGEPSTSHDDEDDEEDDDDDKENHRPARRQRTSPDDEEAGVSQRERQEQARAAIKRKRREYYERGSSWGKPAACLMYDWARELHQDDHHLLWLQIIGLTDQLVHQRIAQERYNQYVYQIEELVKSSGISEAETEVVMIGADDGSGNGPTTFTVQKPAYGKIIPAEDFRFTLMRHWTLYDAMMHSAYVAVRLQTWHDKGRQQLEELLVKMGFPLAQCKLNYSAMRPDLQRQLSHQLELHAARFKLSNITFKSFQLQWGYNCHLTATDAVHAATALLESSGKANAAVPDAADDKFWRAWRAIGVRDGGELKAGLELSKKLMRATLSDGGLIITRNMAADAGRPPRYRYVNLRDQELSNKALLAHPLALTKLGMFLHEAYYIQKHKRINYVLIGPQDAEAHCLVLGLIAQPQLTSVTGNTFGDLFRRAADNIGADYKHDGFDSSVIQVAAADVDRFLAELSHGRWLRPETS
ncbi:hypothetical protein WJX72_006468 [[Myrmecia] bisecta]|uniref:Cell division control protein 45 n=1 Tax=[Myrmecia] bisecta TaxID=41462 RepID=A0AAW1PGA9_9CHLO